MKNEICPKCWSMEIEDVNNYMCWTCLNQFSEALSWGDCAECGDPLFPGEKKICNGCKKEQYDFINNFYQGGEN